MQTLAANVGDLKNVLTNVKVRGTYGEVQLALLLEQFLSPDQYVKNATSAQVAASGLNMPSNSRLMANRFCCQSTRNSRAKITSTCRKRLQLAMRN